VFLNEACKFEDDFAAGDWGELLPGWEGFFCGCYGDIDVFCAGIGDVVGY
jgi:hypothetical protein